MKYSLLVILSFLMIQVYGQDDVKRLMYYGNLEFNEGQYEDALSYFEDAVSYSPLNFKANYNLANAQYRLGDYPKSIETYEKIVNLGPTSFDKSKVYHNMGNAHMMSQNLEGAIAAYENGLRLNPSDEETRYNLAYALNLKQEQDKQEQNSEQNNDNSSGEGNDSEDQNNGENSDDQNNADDEENQNGDQNNDEEEENDEQSEQNSDGNKEENENEEQGSGQQFSNKMSKEDIQQILDTYYKREKKLQERLDKNKRVGYGSPKKKDW